MPEPASTYDRPTAQAAACPHSMDGIRTEHIHPLLPDHVTEPAVYTAQKGDLNHDGILTPADAAIALRIAATGAHDDATDVSGDRVTSFDALMILQAAAGVIELQSRRFTTLNLRWDVVEYAIIGVAIGRSLNIQQFPDRLIRMKTSEIKSFYQPLDESAGSRS